MKSEKKIAQSILLYFANPKNRDIMSLRVPGVRLEADEEDTSDTLTNWQGNLS